MTIPELETSTIMEPFRVKVVEPLPTTTRSQRASRLAEERYNLFGLRAEDVAIDLMTDSGTGAMSQAQWDATTPRGAEPPRGAPAFHELTEVVRWLSGMRHVIPTHQGCAPEHILFSATCERGQAVLSNCLFDTTRANVEAAGAEALDVVIEEGLDPESAHPFKGNVDIHRLEAFMKRNRDRAALVVLTVTNSSAGGHPVSLENARALRRLADRWGVPVFLNCARFAENAFLIKHREPGQAERTTTEIARELFLLADGAFMTAKKRGLLSLGGFLAMNDDGLAARCRSALSLSEGCPTPGGVADRDLSVLAVGLRERLCEQHLAHRLRSLTRLHERLASAGIPLVHPPGGHAIYLDARRFLPHLPPHAFPGQALAAALYIEAGIRSLEIGTLMFGTTRPDGGQEPAPLDLVRLAFPQRVYTQSHIDFVFEAILHLHAHRDQLAGYRIVEEPATLRHYTCALEPLPAG